MIRWKNGRPYVEVDVPGKRERVYVKPRDFGMNLRGLQGRELKRAAVELERRAEEHYRMGLLENETCDRFANRWVEDFPRSEATDKHYRWAIVTFAKDFEGRSLRSVSKPEARAWARKNRARAVVVRTMFGDAILEGLLAENPFGRLQQKQSRGRADITVLTYNEVEDLAATARAVHGAYGLEFAAWVWWMAGTAMRTGESCDARWSLLNGDIYNLQAQFNSHLGKVTEPKHGSIGEIYVPDFTLDALKMFPRRLGDDLMFRSRTGRQLREGTVLYAWGPVRDHFVAKLPASHHLRRRLALDPEDRFVPYELRHFGLAYLLNEMELPPHIVAEQARHSDGGVLVNQLYGHLDRKRALDRIRRAHGGKPQQVSPVSVELEGKAAADAS